MNIFQMILQYHLLQLFTKRLFNDKNSVNLLINKGATVKQTVKQFKRGRTVYSVCFFIIVNRHGERLHNSVFYTKGKMLKTLTDDNVLESVIHALGLHTPTWSKENTISLCNVTINRNRRVSKKTGNAYNAGYSIDGKTFSNLSSAYKSAYTHELLNSNHPHYRTTFQKYVKSGLWNGHAARIRIWRWKATTNKANAVGI